MSNRTPVHATADAVVLREAAGAISGLEALVIRRGKSPFFGAYALPGGHFEPERHNNLEHTAAVELWEETGFRVYQLVPVGTYSDRDRDPRYPTVSQAFLVTDYIEPTNGPRAADDAASAEWEDTAQVLAAGLAFDHAKILTDAIALWPTVRATVSARRGN